MPISRAQSPPLLEIDRVTLRFGGVTALEEVSFTVASGEICGLIGPNGAGKTSLFNCVSRLYAPISGSIRFAGAALESIAAACHSQARRRPHVPESRAL